MYGSWICDLICDTRLDYGYLPSRRTLAPSYWYQISLLRKKRTCVINLPKVVNLELNGRGGGEPANF